MNMNSGPDDFSRLRQLLALKRHEQPPPRYFKEFPGRVVARLQQAKSVESGSWFEQFLQAFELKPMLTGAFGVAAFGLLLFGLVSFERPEDASLAMSPAGNGSRAVISTAETGMTVNQFPTGDILRSSIDPAINTQPPSALFNGFHDVQRVAFRANGN